MHLTVYTSRAIRQFTATNLNDLKSFAGDVNRSSGITGLLVFDGARFIQALEGDKAAVQAIMSRIEKDPRHGNIVYVENTTITHRQFREWSTEYRDAHDLSDGTDFLERVLTRVSDLKNSSTKALFIGFASLAVRRRLKG